jgi:hypothetical protein
MELTPAGLRALGLVDQLRAAPGLAGVEVRMVLAMLMRNFTIELATDPAAVREVLAFTMMPSAMPLRLRARA